MENKITLVFLLSILWASQGFCQIENGGEQFQAYIYEAQMNNPQIRAFELRYAIAEEKVNEAKWLPNTEIGAGYFVSEPETRTGAQRARFSIKQLLPWFGTLTARENLAGSLIETEFLEIAIAKRKLALSVSQSYYKLYGINAKKEILGQNMALLKTYEKLALTSVETGNASAVDVLRLQIRQNELQQQSDVLLQEFSAEQTVFNTLLNRAADSTVTVVEKLVLPLSDPTAGAEGLGLNPELLKYDRLYESVVRSELLNQKKGLPMLGFGLEYVPVSERADLSFDDNGKDIVMPMVSLSIPIFNSRYKSLSKQNELRQQEIRFRKADRTNTLRGLLAQAESHRTIARIQYETQQKNLKQATDAEEILLKNYETGTIDFNDLLDIQQLQLQFQMEQIASVQHYFEQSALINYLTNK